MIVAARLDLLSQEIGNWKLGILQVALLYLSLHSLPLALLPIWAFEPPVNIFYNRLSIISRNFTHYTPSPCVCLYLPPLALHWSLSLKIVAQSTEIRNVPPRTAVCAAC